jgi:hypothetical protein
MQIRPAALGIAIIVQLVASGCGRTHDGGFDLGLVDKAGTGAKAGNSGGSGKGGSAGRPGDPVKPSDPTPVDPKPVDPKPVDPRLCGNERLDDFEECEGELRFSCSDVGFGFGVVRCDPDSCLLDVSACSNPLPLCSNDAPPGVSQLCVAALCSCDPGLVANCGDACWRQIQCRILACGSSAGDPSCRPDACPTNNTQQQDLGLKLLGCVQGNPLCGPDPRIRSCGDGVLQGGEECDGSNFGGLSCARLGFDSGSLSCTANCRIDSRACFTDDDDCGNGVIDSGEQCDGMRLNGVTCGALGFGSGALFCGSGCRFDTSLCAVCGNGKIEAGENCDGGNLGSASCDSLGLGSGSLACSPTSCHFDTRSCMAGAQCGNGVAEADEDCDRGDLTAHSCDTLGFRFGTVGCNTSTCRFDLSGCTGAGSIECVDQCIDASCMGLVERCLASPDCQKIRSCLDSCRSDPSVDCGLSCTGNLAGVALATVASDCVADCVDGCR